MVNEAPQYVQTSALPARDPPQALQRMIELSWAATHGMLRAAAGACTPDGGQGMNDACRLVVPRA